MRASLVDLRTHLHDDVLDHIERRLDVRLDRPAGVYGNNGGTAGFRTDRETWLRVEWRRPDRADSPSWAGLEAAAAVRGVSKPDLLEALRWWDARREVVWRADEMTLVPDAIVSMSGSITSTPELPHSWWQTLKESLDALAAHKTVRVGMRQAHFTRRITEVFGTDVDTTIDEWTTAHADLHWGNLTAPRCWLLDWEDWGAGPRGLDAATLWGFSLGVPDLADRVQAEFGADLQTRSGKLAQLLFCANALRAHARNSKAMPFTEPARAAAEALLDDLKT
ncbi:aminoglycoside phosphotransferase [Streptomyces sp. NPDC019890]|uniref:aminoglycoside phosphotransferase n=1 Tax=Streptomyces sp. NPDC019890 TaxID=3365064 RepID=UPI0038507655